MRKRACWRQNVYHGVIGGPRSATGVRDDPWSFATKWHRIRIGFRQYAPQAPQAPTPVALRGPRFCLRDENLISRDNSMTSMTAQPGWQPLTRLHRLATVPASGVQSAPRAAIMSAGDQ